MSWNPSIPFRLSLIAPGGGLFLLFCGAAFALYGGGLDAPLVFDDPALFNSGYVSAFGAEFHPLTARYWPTASFAHQSLLWDHGVVGMRAGNVLLHAMTAFTLTLFIVKLLAATAIRDGQRGAPRVALSAVMAGLLYLAHPAAVYAVAYLVQRSVLMATLFSLVMWLAYLEGIQSGRRRWLVLSILCYYLAVFSKQHAVLAPLVPLALSILFRQAVHRTNGWLALAPVFALYLVIAIVAVLPATALLGTNYEPMLAYLSEGAGWHERILLLERVHWMSILTQASLFFKYLAVWAWPDPAAMSIDMRETFVETLADTGSWFGLAAFLVFGLLAVVLLMRGGRVGLVGLGMFVSWGLFWVELSTVRLQEVFVLYRSYFWATGLVIGVAVGLNAVAERIRLRWLWPPYLLVLTGLVLVTEQRLATFSSDKLLWQDAVRLVERSVKPRASAERAYHNRGAAYARDGDLEHALADYDKALSYNDRFYLGYCSRAQVLAELGRLREALVDYDRALAIRPGYSDARLGRAGVLERMGNRGEALAELKRACAESNMRACYRHHKLTDPTSEFRFQVPH